MFYFLNAAGENAGLWDATAGHVRWITDSVGNFAAGGRVTAQGAFPQMMCVGTAGSSGAIALTNDSGKTFCLGIGAYAGNDTYFGLYNMNTGSHPLIIDQSDNATFGGNITSAGKLVLTEGNYGNYCVSAQEAWIDLPLPGPGWTLLNAADKPQYMKDSFGFVHMRGKVQVTGSDTATLPAGYRPAAYSWVGGVSNSFPGWGAGISTTGGIQSLDSTVSYIIFDNVCFRAA